MFNHKLLKLNNLSLCLQKLEDSLVITDWKFILFLKFSALILVLDIRGSALQFLSIQNTRYHTDGCFLGKFDAFHLFDFFFCWHFFEVWNDLIDYVMSFFFTEIYLEVFIVKLLFEFHLNKFLHLILKIFYVIFVEFNLSKGPVKFKN